MILYFSATGNSEYAARALAALLGDTEVVSLQPYIRTGERLAVRSEKPYVVLAPVYISTLPDVVQEVLRGGSLEGSRELYFVMTCAGHHSAAGAFARALCEEKGMHYCGTAHLSMPQDYLMYFTTEPRAECREKLDAAIRQLPALAARIRQGLPLEEKPAGRLHAMVIRPTVRLFQRYFIRPEKFYATAACVSCGVCERVCPLGNIRLEKGRPVWGARCIHCTACINRCPREAIDYGRKTRGKPRYTAPDYPAQP